MRGPRRPLGCKWSLVKSSRPDSEGPGITRESEVPGPLSFPHPASLTTGSPSRAADASPAELIRAALTALDGGVVRLGDLREFLARALACLEDGNGAR